MLNLVWLGEGGGWPALSSSHRRDSSHVSALSFVGWLESSSGHSKWSRSHLEGPEPACTRAVADAFQMLGLWPLLLSWLYTAAPAASNTSCYDMAMRSVSSERWVPCMEEQDSWWPCTSWRRGGFFQLAAGWGCCTSSTIPVHSSAYCIEDD